MVRKDAPTSGNWPSASRPRPRGNNGAAGAGRVGRATIVVIGSINIDLISRVSRLPRPGETLTGDSFHALPGGKGANQAVAAARLGARVHMVGRVGDDAYGRQLRAGLKREGVNVRHVRTNVGLLT